MRKPIYVIELNMDEFYNSGFVFSELEESVNGDKCFYYFPNIYDATSCFNKIKNFKKVKAVLKEVYEVKDCQGDCLDLTEKIIDSI